MIAWNYYTPCKERQLLFLCRHKGIPGFVDRE